MKYKKYLLCSICFLIIILGICIRQTYRICNINYKPSYFDEWPEIFNNPLEFNVIDNSKEAVNFAKAAIRSVYDEPTNLHTKYNVYFDDKNGLYYIYAEGLFLHESVYIIISRKDGRVMQINHIKTGI